MSLSSVQFLSSLTDLCFLCPKAELDCHSRLCIFSLNLVDPKAHDFSLITIHRVTVVSGSPVLTDGILHGLRFF